ncbi:MAG TPA: sulfotransferase [Aliidongia sp.]|nr:sulfotransferase [Aliidongia sp.]
MNFLAETDDLRAALWREAEQWRREGQLGRAETAAQELLEAFPEDAGALHMLGLIADARQDPAIAADYLERACAAEAALPIYFRNLAELHRRQRRYALAEAAATQALARDARLTSAWDTLGRIRVEAGNPAGARPCFETVLALQPNFSGAMNNLGVVLQQLDELDAARAQYERALTLDPDNASVHANLAAVLARLGEFGLALDAVRRAVELTPPNLNAYLIGAEVEQELRRYDRALDWLDGAHILWPQEPIILQRRAVVLLKQRRLDEGLAACRELRKLHFEDGNTDNVAGLLLRELGRPDEALAAFEAAAAGLPQPSGVLSNRAVLLTELGRGHEAMICFEQALAHDPDQVDAWYGKADLKKFAAGDPDLAAMEALLARMRGYRERLTLHFALGKAYLDHGDGERAFAHLDAGNRLKRVNVDYDDSVVGNLMAQIAASCPQAMLDRLATGGLRSDRPVFVVGMPRSGTTLVEHILASHPRAKGAGEPYLMRDLARNGQTADGLPGAYPALLAELDPERLRAMSRTYLARLEALVPPADRIIDKMPTNFLYLGLIRAMLPAARIIHCRRNPLDTCLSGYSKLFSGELDFSYDQGELGRYYRHYRGLMAHWRAVLPPQSICEIDYESLVADVAGETARLLEFCGLPWDDACLRFHETQRTVSSASVNQVRQPIYGNSVGRAAPYRRFLGPLIEALGDIVPSA